MKKIIFFFILLSAFSFYAQAQNSNVRRPTVTRTRPSKKPAKTTSKPTSPGKRQSSGTSYVRHHGLVAVDLGLSVKWASCNLGASDPWDYGNYYKWGETQPADDKGRATYKYDNSVYDSNTKTLKPEYDAATVKLGGNWRMPTDKEIEELIDKCQHKWTKFNGINGIRVTGPNGNSIFIPASGCRDNVTGSLDDLGSSGYCWSSAPYGGYDGYNLYFDRGAWFLSGSRRARGFSVRPVLAE